MIFLLKDAVTGEKCFLTEPKEYIVGRKDCDIILENDQSISRRHAVIKVKGDHVTLEDCKSKYHTLHNGVQVTPGVDVTLKHMDSIHFGALNSKFIFEAYKFITSGSALNSEKKQALKENIAKCNGKYVEKWSSNCTHLTVDKITLTIKVLQALIDEKPIVTPEFWLRYAQSIENKTAPPDINNYNKPPVAEQLLRSDFQYKLDPGRKTLFKNKMFVFLNSNTKKQMDEVVKGCGGECMSWDEEGPKTYDEMSKSSKEHLIIKTENDDEDVSFNAVVRDLVKHKKRAIPLQEIALSIVHCSCEINCNPNFNKVTEVFQMHTQKQQTMGILAADTQTQDVVASKIKAEKVIPSTLEDDWTLTVPNTAANPNKQAGPAGLKRASNGKDNAGVFKKPKIEEEENKRQEKLKEIENIVSVSQRDSVNKKAEKNIFKNKSQPSQKRKAEEELEDANAKKLNPFSCIKVVTNKKNTAANEENPFEITRSSNKPSSSSTNSAAKYKNPFAGIPNLSKSTHDIIPVKDENIRPKLEPKREIKLIPNKSDISAVSSLKRSLLNMTWMSKDTSVVKNEIKEEDPELLEIAKAFKDSVKVGILPVYNKHKNSRDCVDNTAFQGVGGEKNFKKFKKVKPIRPQVTIIPRNQLTRIAPGDVTGIEVSGLNDSDDEAVPNNAVQQKAKQKVKKFVL